MPPGFYVPIQGCLLPPASAGGPPRHPLGESLERAWDGAEVGYLDSLAALREVVAEVRRRGWALGLHWPAVKKDPAMPRWFDPDPPARRRALDEAREAVRQARHLGAVYVLFHFPWPGLADEGADYRSLGWYFTTPLVPAAAWPEREARAWAGTVIEELAGLAARSGVEVVLEIDGPCRVFCPGRTGDDILGPLLDPFLAGAPGVGLCLDTGRLDLIARTHGQDPLRLARRWYNITRQLHLHASRWAERQNHVPAHPGQKVEEGWGPAVTVAEELAARRPGLRVVLEHDPAKAGPGELEACHRWVRRLGRRELPAGCVHPNV